ncbi:MAG TPA: hypothetical protein VGK59_06475 [Ohtaekwangia sp.]
MKKLLVATTRWEYYAANIGGILALTAASISFIFMAIEDKGINFGSVFFWLALLLLIIIPYSLIGFFSSMETVEVTATELTIFYVFQKHTNVIRFPDIAALKSHRTGKATKKHQGLGRDTFTITLHDGRAFEFERSQFHHYSNLKEICQKHIKG